MFIHLEEVACVAQECACQLSAKQIFSTNASMLPR
jgi:hypothetical protein